MSASLGYPFSKVEGAGKERQTLGGGRVCVRQQGPETWPQWGKLALEVLKTFTVPTPSPWQALGLITPAPCWKELGSAV